jgi:peptidoglycan/LPS O-acetylase OafA/YrhL
MWTVIRYLHEVALAFFLGGQLMLVMAVVPVVRRHGSEAAMAAVARRFGIGSGVALVVLLATGIAMAGHYSRWEDSTLQIKLMLVVLLAVLLGMHVVSPKARALSIAVLLSTLVIVWLGVELAHGL